MPRVCSTVPCFANTGDLRGSVDHVLRIASDAARRQYCHSAPRLPRRLVRPERSSPKYIAKASRQSGCDSRRLTTVPLSPISRGIDFDAAQVPSMPSATCPVYQRPHLTPDVAGDAFRRILQVDGEIDAPVSTTRRECPRSAFRWPHARARASFHRRVIDAKRPPFIAVETEIWIGPPTQRWIPPGVDR